MKNLTFAIIASAIFGLASISTQAQFTSYVYKKFENQNNHPDTLDWSASTTDKDGNIIVASNTVLPGWGGTSNLLVTKFDSTGFPLWEKAWNGAFNNNDYGTAVDTDSSGNVYVAGATVASAMPGDFDYVVLKYNSAGGLQWWRLYGGAAELYDVPTGILVDDTGAVYVTGASYDNIADEADYFTRKYDTDGNIIWSHRYDYAGYHDIPASIIFGKEGEIMVIGASGATASAWDFATLEINPLNGDVLDSNREPGAPGWEAAIDIAQDAEGNLYVTGTDETGGTKDIKTIKLDTLLNTEWWAVWDGPAGLDDIGVGVETDLDGNIYVGGQTTKSNGAKDYVVIKYDPSGTIIWERQYAALDPALEATAKHLTIDKADKRIFISGTVDNGDNLDIMTLMYDINGNLLWEERYNGVANGDDKITFLQSDRFWRFTVGGKTWNGSDFQNLLIRYDFVNHTIPLDTAAIPTSMNYFENKGQLIDTEGNLRNDIKFYSRQHNPALYFMDDTVSFVFSKIDTAAGAPDSMVRVDMSWVGSNTAKTINLNTPNKGNYHNYYLPHCSDGAVLCRSTPRLICHHVYKAAGVEFTFDEAGYKYYIVLRPGYKPVDDPFIMEYKGADSVWVDTANNELHIETALGSMVHTAPKTYLMNWKGQTINPPLTWQAEYTDLGNNKIGFDLGSYNTTKYLVLQVELKRGAGGGCPDGLAWSTYWGGEDRDRGKALSIDDNEDVFMAGESSSLSFPVNAGGLDTVNAGSFDAFIAKFAHIPLGGNSLEWNTFYGGIDDDYAHDVVADHLGRVAIAGYSESNNLPLLDPSNGGGAYFESFGTSNADAYIARFNGNTGFHQWGTYYPGDEGESFEGLATDNESNIYAVGWTSSSNVDLLDPADGSWFSTTGQGLITRFDSAAELTWATRYGVGGVGIPNGTKIHDVDHDGVRNLYLTGQTSEGANFPIVLADTASYFQDSTYGGGSNDAFVARLSNTCGTDGICWSTYFGGPGADIGHSVAYNSSNGVQDIYVTGETVSQIGFPHHLSPNPNGYNDTTFGGGVFFPDMFIARFSNNGQQKWATYYGTGGQDRGRSVFVHNSPETRVYVTGQIGDDDVDLVELADYYYQDPASGGTQLIQDAVILAFDNQDSMRWGTAFGGSAADIGWDIAVSGGDAIYLCGETASTQWIDLSYVKFPLCEKMSPAYFQSLPDSVEEIQHSEAFISKFQIPFITGIETEHPLSDAFSGLTVFPNPNKGGFNYLLNRPNFAVGQISVANVFGQVLHQNMQEFFAGENIFFLDLGKLPNGFYLLNVFIDGENITGKIVIER